MTFSPPEAAWLYFRLVEHGKRAPSSRTFEPYYNASSWDLQDLFRAFRADATELPAALSKAGLVVTRRAAWPRMKTCEAFWIRERWGMAERYCLEVSGMNTLSGGQVASTPPADPESAILGLLTDLWNERLVDVWIRENARSYVSVDDYSLQESITDLEVYLRKLERTR